MAGRLRSIFGAAALAALLAMPVSAEAAPAQTPALQAWLNSASPKLEAPVRHRQKRGRSARSQRPGSRGLEGAHAAPLALVWLDDPWPRRRHGIVAERRR
jgi:hypothetical protein